MVRNNIFKISALILSGFLSVVIHADCIEGKVKFIERDKEVIHAESYCFDSDLKILLSTKSCGKKKECQSRNLETIKMKIEEIASEAGSFGFKICEKFHGTPQILEYWGNDKWNPSSRCLFKDGSFIDTASLSQKVNFQE